MYKFISVRSILWAVLVACALTASAKLDLPVKEVNGKQCYYYKVERGNTVYGIANKLGITRDQIISYNPSAADGLSSGMILYFPVDVFGQPDDSNSASKSETASTTSKTENATRYVVEKGETLFGIGHKFGVSAEEIIALNPGAAQGIKSGDVLLIPNKSASTETNTTANTSNNTAEETAAEDGYIPAVSQKLINLIDGINASNQERKLTPVNPEVTVVSTNIEDNKNFIESVHSQTINGFTAIEHSKPITVSIILPFMAGEEKAGRAGTHAAEFYRGFLIAADTLKSQLPQVNINVYDTKNNLDRLRSLLDSEAAIAQSDVIIAPDAADQLKALSDFGKSHNILIFNPLNARDTLYRSNPYMLQGSIPSASMYEKAVDAFLKSFDGYTPVLLSNTTGRPDKQTFVDMLKEKLNAKGIVPLMIEYEGALYAELISEQLGEVTANSKFVFVPMSGSLTEYNKFVIAVANFKDQATEVGAKVCTWGYPEWVTFRGDAQKELYDISTTLYTRSYIMPEDAGNKGLNNSFVKWYGQDLIDGVPAQGVLGFDCGVYILKGLATGTLKSEPDANADTRGIQNTFRMRHIDGSKGLANDALYIIRLHEDGSINIEVI